MSLEAGTVIAALALVASFAWGFANYKRNHKTDTKEETAQATTIMVKLEYLQKSVDRDLFEIKQTLNRNEAENKEMRKEYTVLCERVAAVERDIKSAHHRLDTIPGTAQLQSHKTGGEAPWIGSEN